MNYNTSCILRGFEQLSCWIGWRVIVVQSSAKKTGEKELKGLKCNYIEIKGKNFVGHLFKIDKISNEDILKLKCPQWDLSVDVLFMPIACVLVRLSPLKIYVTHSSDFDDYPFSLPQNWG